MRVHALQHSAATFNSRLSSHILPTSCLLPIATNVQAQMTPVAKFQLCKVTGKKLWRTWRRRSGWLTAWTGRFPRSPRRGNQVSLSHGGATGRKRIAKPDVRTSWRMGSVLTTQQTGGIFQRRYELAWISRATLRGRARNGIFRSLPVRVKAVVETFVSFDRLMC